MPSRLMRALSRAPRRERADVVRLVSRIRKFYGTLRQLREADGLSYPEVPRRRKITVARDSIDENRN